MLNSEIENTAEIANESINNEVIMNELTNENINPSNEVKMNTEKKQRKSRIDNEIERTKDNIANAKTEERKKHYERHLEFLLEDKAEKEAENRAKKSDAMTDYRIGKMSNDDIKRMYHRYRNEMLKREIPLD